MRTRKVTNADRATAFAIQAGVNIVSDMFGDYFVVHAERDEVYHLAKIDPTAHGGVRWSTRDFKDLALAKLTALNRGGDHITPLISVPDQTAVNDFCQRTGMKASDDMYGDFVVVSAPLRDQIRRWHVAKRVGNSLKLVGESEKDRYAAKGKAQRLGGTTEPRTVLGGPFAFPYGNNFHGQPLKRRVKKDEDDDHQNAA